MSKAAERTKVVVRTLPPTLPEESFRAAIDKHAAGTYSWLCYYPGKVSLKRSVHSRAYLDFNSPDAVLEFKARFDGHVFVSTRGSQYRCAVEYAPCQRVPSSQQKKAQTEGTIEKDKDYQAFLQQLEAGPQSLPSAAAQLEAKEAEQRAAAAAAGDAAAGARPVIVTPLMDFLQKKYEAGGMVPRRGRMAGRRPDAQPAKGGRLEPITEKPGQAGSKGPVRKGTAGTAAAADAQRGGRPPKGAAKDSAPAGGSGRRGAAASKEGAAAGREGATATKAGKGAGNAGGGKADAAARSSAPKPAKPAASSSAAASSATADKKAGKRPAAAAGAASSSSHPAAAPAPAGGEAAAAADGAAPARRAPRMREGHAPFAPGARNRLFAAALGKATTAGEAGGADAQRGSGRRASGGPGGAAAEGESSNKRDEG